jgi:hypothetical protein
MIPLNRIISGMLMETKEKKMNLNRKVVQVLGDNRWHAIVVK